MKDNDFQQLVDEHFSVLSWTDAQRMAALQKMNKEVRPVMKKKVVIALAVVVSVILLSVTALAVSLGFPGIQELIDQSDRRAREYDYEPFTVAAEAVVTPKKQRHTSQLVDIAIHEAYLTTEALYLTIHVAPAGENVVLWDDAAPPTSTDQPLRYFDLYREEGIVLLDFQDRKSVG